jgi:hypothetical protein
MAAAFRPGVVSWLLEDGPFEYWRGQVTALQMKFL